MPFIVKSSTEDTWSGSGPGDPEFPPLGRECVDDVTLAHRFDDFDEAIEEAQTYNQGAFVLSESGHLVGWTYPDGRMRRAAEAAHD